MRPVAFLGVAVLAMVQAVEARPLITNSEETYARICLSHGDTLPRVLGACDAALSEPDVTFRQTLQMLVAKGDALRLLDRPEQAATVYRDAIALDPAIATAWAGLGWTERAAGNPGDAWASFERSLELRTTSSALMGYAATGREIGEFDGTRARDYLDAALIIDPDEVWAQREIGWSWFDEGEFDRAHGAFQRALEMLPQDAASMYGLGHSSEGQGQFEEALSWYNEAIIADPQYHSARIQRIVVLRALNRNAQAVRSADRLIEDYPDHVSGYIQKGLALADLERLSRALATFRDAEANLGPSNALLYWYADTLARDHQFNEALSAIDRGIELDGSDYSDYLLKAYIGIEMGDDTVARSAAQTAMEFNPSTPWSHYYLAIAFARAGDAEVAVDTFRRAIDLGLPASYVSDFARELYSAGTVELMSSLRREFMQN